MHREWAIPKKIGSIGELYNPTHILFVLPFLIPSHEPYWQDKNILAMLLDQQSQNKNIKELKTDATRSKNNLEVLSP